jgi:hypothetical protein
VAKQRRASHNLRLKSSGCGEGSLRGQLPWRFRAVESTLACCRPSPFARRVEAGLSRKFFNAGRPDPAGESGRTTKGAQQVRRESASTRFSRTLARDPAGRLRFCPRAHGASAPETVPLAGWVTQTQPTECAETAGSVRGVVVHAVCPCSLTVAEVGRRRRFGVAIFGCGWKWNRPS